MKMVEGREKEGRRKVEGEEGRGKVKMGEGR